MQTILKKSALDSACGCDVVVALPEERRGTEIKLLQITDMQFIDSFQRRTPDRLRTDEINAWAPQNLDAQCGNQLRALVAETQPDLIFITGDMVYGSFDDAGTTFLWFCSLMDSFQIPWAPVFGNHDNESKMGVDWQCAQFERCEWCLFSRGNVSGNGNYTVGITVGGELVRVLHMLDSNGCSACEDPAVIREKGIYPDQLQQIRAYTQQITEYAGKAVPAFCAFHIPTEAFVEAELAAGYAEAKDDYYTIGIDHPAKNGDFGCKLEKYTPIRTEEAFVPFLHENHIDGVFVGHCHRINTCILYENIRFVFGMKTGQYDYHIPGQLGGTLVRLAGDSFVVTPVPALVPYAPFPGGSSIFDGYFAEDKELLPGNR